jgi:ATP-binding cassette, subfamily C, bacterial
VEHQRSPRAFAREGESTVRGVAPPDDRSPVPLQQLAQYLRTLIGAEPGRLALALALMAVGALTEGLGLLVLVPLLNLIGLDVQQGSVGRLASAMAAAFARLGLPLNLVSVLVIYVALIAFDATIRRRQTVTYCALQVGITAHLRKRLHRAVTRAGWVQLTRCRASDLTNAMTGQVERVGHATQLVLSLLRDAMLACVYLAVTLYISPPVTVLVIAAGAGLLLVLGRTARAATHLGQELARVGGEAYRAVMEHLGSIKMAKSYGAEERSMRLFGELADTVAATNLRAAIAQAHAKGRFDIGAALVLGVVLYVAIALLHTPTAVILVLIFAFARVMPLVSGVEQEVQQLLNMLPELAAVLALERRLAPAESPSPERRGPLPLRDAVRLDAVSFRYEEAAQPALDALSLTIPAGQTTAIVGPSGSGKSTLADLLLGLLVPARGRVLVDETPLTVDLLAAWREQIGYVPQDSFHFHDTVRANLLWARPEASDAELLEALEIAAAGFVTRLPQGLDTVLGDRGVRLSGGERQRIALARALVRRPSMLILDEATSSLDSENERRVQDAIERLHGRLTVLVITHRLTTVRLADSIHVLEAGRLVESGNWHGLLNGSAGRFRAMCEAQGLPV